MDRTKVAIVSVVYHEKEWEETRRCVEACGVSTYFVERNPPGIGSLSEALNRGFRYIYEKVEPEYVWFVTNVVFNEDVLSRLIDLMDVSCWDKTAALHPYFNSDHPFMRHSIWNQTFKNVPFVEFTAPIVRADLFAANPLNENMPYVGFDMAWGHEMRKQGYSLSVHLECRISHTYNRFMKTEPITRQRARLRQRAIQSTNLELIKLYGRDFRKKLGYGGKL